MLLEPTREKTIALIDDLKVSTAILMQRKTCITKEQSQ